MGVFLQPWSSLSEVIRSQVSHSSTWPASFPLLLSEMNGGLPHPHHPPTPFRDFSDLLTSPGPFAYQTSGGWPSFPRADGRLPRKAPWACSMERLDLLTPFSQPVAEPFCVCACARPRFFLEKIAFISKPFLLGQRLFLMECGCPGGGPDSQALAMHCNVLIPETRIYVTDWKSPNSIGSHRTPPQKPNVTLFYACAFQNLLFNHKLSGVSHKWV